MLATSFTTNTIHGEYKYQVRPFEAPLYNYFTVDSRRAYTGLETTNIFDLSAPRLGLLDLSE